MLIDPLSDVLSLLTPHTFVAGGFDLSGSWSIGFEPHTGIKCYAVLAGGCWVQPDGCDAVRLERDDCVLLPNGRGFHLTSDPSLVPTPFETRQDLTWRGGLATLGSDGDTVILGGHFAFGDRHADFLLRSIPPVVRLREEDDRAAMRWALARLRQELTNARPGSVLVAQHLAHMILVQALRLLMTQSTDHQPGWLFALADPRLSAAIGAIHADPGAPWTVSSLAAVAGMSRSQFARAFKDAVGSSPIEYVAGWRMLLASARLERGDQPIATIARSLGYSSESAFSAAFKRMTGRSPRERGRSAAPITRHHPWPATALGRT